MDSIVKAKKIDSLLSVWKELKSKELPIQEIHQFALLEKIAFSYTFNKPDSAIAVFTELTEAYPELPEPYNNLAVLYANQNNFEKARNALEMVIRTHPSYATAHENLGDIYAKMASKAYDRALELDRGNRTTKT